MKGYQEKQNLKKAPNKPKISTIKKLELRLLSDYFSVHYTQETIVIRLFTWLTSLECFGDGVDLLGFRIVDVHGSLIFWIGSQTVLKIVCLTSNYAKLKVGSFDERAHFLGLIVLIFAFRVWKLSSWHLLIWFIYLVSKCSPW
jgi:hypothetical protein